MYCRNILNTYGNNYITIYGLLFHNVFVFSSFFQLNNLKAAGVDLVCVGVDLNTQELIKIGEGNARDFIDKDNTAFKMLSCFNIGNKCNF